MSQQELELPKGWILTDLITIASSKKHAIVDGPFGSQLKKNEFKEKGIPVIEMANLQNDVLITSFRRYITKEKFSSLERSSVTNDDIIISKTGTLGKLAIVPKEINGAIITSRLAKMSFNQDIIDLSFVFLFLKNLSLSHYWEKISKGTTMKILTIKNLSTPKILLPPLNEQKRIVSKIEELFSKIDSTKQLLEHTKLQLEQYRKSLLESAFEGKLTNNKKHETDEKILKYLELIEIERKNVFKKTILKNGFSEKNFKLLPPREHDQENMPISTKKWHIVSLETVCSFVQGGSTPLRTENSNFSETGFPLIKVENILKNGEVFLKHNQLRITPKPQNKKWKSKVFPDDLLINIVGPPLGKIGLVPKKFPESNINQAIVLMRTVPSYLNKFLLYCLQSPKYYDYQLKLSSGVRQENIRKSSIGTIPIPLPSLEEQEQIVSQIEQGFLLIESTSQIVESSLQNLQTMKMSILKQAFEGKLVPQDPNDEPASVLLERIKSTKESQITKQRRTKNVK
jgi:type I restriction enzyme, S subunit